MSGVYVHIPYCTQKCIYCDFYSLATRKSKKAYLEALVREMQLRKDYLQEPIKTLYFGGGTPSNLDKEEMSFVFNSLKSTFDLSSCEELTVEANPEHLEEQYLSFLRRLGFNRISIGVQSFKDNDLKTLRRRHNSEQAIGAITKARQQGFDNISLDLMFNLPNQTTLAWKQNLEKAVELLPEHLSCYSLTVEEGTILSSMIDKGKIDLPSEQESLAQFDLTMQYLSEAGYEHYEVSSYCKPHFHSRHNVSYWIGEPYLGLGASAHSFNLREREWNPASLELYEQNISKALPPEKEILSLKDRYNEYIMLSLRTAKGIDRNHIATHYPDFLPHYDKQLKRCEAYLKDYWHLQNRIAVELML